MAAPVPRGFTAPTNTQAPTSPASTQIGDLVIVRHWAIGGSGALGLTAQAGYTEELNHFHNDGTTDGQLGVGWKIATAAGAVAYQAFAETGTVTTRLAGIDVVQAGTFDPADPFADIQAVTTTNNAAPNPPGLSGLVSGDYLVFAGGAWHSTAAASWTITAPANYSLQSDAAGSSTGELAIATRALTGITAEDPAAFSDNQTPNGAVGLTFAIQAAGTVHTRTPTDTLGLADAVTPTLSLGRQIADAEDLADVVSRVQAHARPLADVEALEDRLVAAYGEIFDYFDRTVVDGWGSADGGGAWALQGVAADYDVNGGRGRISLVPSGVRNASIGAAIAQGEIFARLAISALPTGGTIQPIVSFRYVDNNNRYRFRLQMSTSGFVQILAQVQVAATATDLGAAVVTDIPRTTDELAVRVLFTEDTPGELRIRGKVWRWGESEPAFGDASKSLDVTDTVEDFADGKVAIGGFNAATNSTIELSFESFHVNELGGAVAHSRTPADVEGLSDSVAQVSSHRRAPADVEALADVAAAAIRRTRAIADTETLADLAGYVRLAQRSVADTETLADAATRVLRAARTPADVLALSDATSRLLARARSVSDTEELSDATSRIHTHRRTQADLEELADSMSYAGAGVHTRTIGDVLALADAMVRRLVYTRSLGDLEGLADLAVSSRVLIRSAADLETLADATSVTKALRRAPADELTLADAIAVDQTGKITRAIADVLGLSDAMVARILETTRTGQGFRLGGAQGASIRSGQGFRVRGGR